MVGQHKVSCLADANDTGASFEEIAAFMRANYEYVFRD